jgi:hypothetical protein
MGGSDDPSNLVELTIEEHAKVHLELYYKHEKKEDLGAYYLLSGQTEEAMKICQSLGGKIQGVKNRDSGHMNRIQKMSDVVESGRLGGKKVIELRKGSFGDPKQRIQAATKGGCVQGKINAESDHLKIISQKYWSDIKSGKKSRTKKKWVHNVNKKISILIPDEQEIPEGFSLGRKIKW